MKTKINMAGTSPRRAFWWNLLWSICFLIYVLTATVNAVYLLSADSAMNLYYQILIPVNIYFLIPYCLNALSVILNVLAILPFYLYIRRIEFLSASFWQWFLIVRLAADMTGRSYEAHFIKSLFYQNVQAGLSVICLGVCLALPSYIALYQYASMKHPSQKTFL